jgi:phosphatidylglycerophosphatase A
MSNLARPPVRVSTKFMLPRFSRWIGLGLGSGLAPLMPGTAGSLAAWVIFNLAGASTWPAATIGLVLVGAFVLGCWASERVAHDLGVADHGAIVWDEFVGMWLVLAFVPAAWSWQLAGFLVFRFFDMVKPPPIRWFDRSVKGGVGIMLDDVVAALFTLFVLAWFR